jgi:hypothetical protein
MNLIRAGPCGPFPTTFGVALDFPDRAMKREGAIFTKVKPS